VISAIADCPFGFRRCRPKATERPTAFFLPVQQNRPFDRSKPTVFLPPIAELSFRPEQTDTFAFHLRSREGVGLRSGEICFSSHDLTRATPNPSQITPSPSPSPSTPAHTP
jgi:hypothetical protein